MDASSNFLPREYGEMNLSVRLVKGLRNNDKSGNELLKLFLQDEIV